MAAGAPLPVAWFGFEVVGDGAAWRVVHAHVREGLSELYEATLDLATEDPAAQPGTLLGRPVALTFTRGAFVRRVAGIARAVEDLGWLASRRVARVVVVPELWLLSQRSDCRVYQDATALEVVREVLRDAGLYQQGGRLREEVLPDACARREYCVQLRETDLDFVARLLEQEGLAFYFTHEGAQETLVLADCAARTPPPAALADAGPVPLMPHGGAAGAPTAARETVQRFDWSRALTPTQVTARDYNFTNPDTVLDLTRSHPPDASPARALYEYPGSYALGDYDGGVYRAHDGGRVARTRFESAAARRDVGRGTSNVTGLLPGHTFTLADPGRPDLAGPWLVTDAEHALHAEEELAHDAGGGGREGERYENRFEVIPAGTAFRPARVAPRPALLGPQTARVEAEPGSSEEICTDRYGRVLVRFHWDRPDRRSPRQRALRSSCWVRVAQAWAGAAWGAVFVPRVGMEVVVQFLDGDPDRPLITGCVYNGANPPPLRLPDERTRTTLRTRSSPGGDGFNELTFEDLAGRERVYLRAQRDLDEEVLHDHATAVRGDQANRVGRDQTEAVERHQTVTVRGDRRHTVGGAETVTVLGDQTTTVGGDQTETVKQQRAATVHGDESLHVRRSRSTLVDQDDATDVSGQRFAVVRGNDAAFVLGAALTQVDASYDLTAGTYAKLVVGTGVVNVEPDYVAVGASGEVLLNVGAATVRLFPDRVVLDSGGGASLELSGDTVRIRATNIEIEGTTAVTVRSPAEVTVDGRVTTVRGSPLKLNC